MKRWVAVLTALAALAPAGVGARPMGALRLQAFFSSPSVPTACRPDAPAGTSCKALRASATVRGLGNVTLDAIEAITDPGFHVNVSGRLVVTGKGFVGV